MRETISEDLVLVSLLYQWTMCIWLSSIRLRVTHISQFGKKTILDYGGMHLSPSTIIGRIWVWKSAYSIAKRRTETMFMGITKRHAEALDEIIHSRHSVRVFSQKEPSNEVIEEVIKAGLVAPFAAMPVVGRKDFRKVIVMPKASQANVAASKVMIARIGSNASEMEKKAGQVPFVKYMRRVAEQGIPGVGDAPYFIVVGERKGMPPIAAQSICYCMSAMWLKATSLGIGFHLVSIVMQMGSDPEFCRLLGLPCGEYALDGCALGYPAEGSQPSYVNYPDYAESVKWL
jgi:nitroreductase